MQPTASLSPELLKTSPGAAGPLQTAALEPSLEDQVDELGALRAELEPVWAKWGAKEKREKALAKRIAERIQAAPSAAVTITGKLYGASVHPRGNQTIIASMVDFFRRVTGTKPWTPKAQKVSIQVDGLTKFLDNCGVTLENARALVPDADAHYLVTLQTGGRKVETYPVPAETKVT